LVLSQETSLSLDLLTRSLLQKSYFFTLDTEMSNSRIWFTPRFIPIHTRSLESASFRGPVCADREINPAMSLIL
jgi:hypothetical protein